MKDTAQKMKRSIKHFFSKYNQIRRKLQIWQLLLKKVLMENFICCAVERNISLFINIDSLVQGSNLFHLLNIMLLITFEFIKKNGNSRIYTFYTSKSIFGIKSFGILNLGIIKLYKTTNFVANKCSPPLMNSSNKTFYHITSYPIYFISQQTTSKLSTSHSCSLRISKFTEFRIF